MDTYYTIEEKYLQAVDELTYGENPKALKLLNEIISNDPLYARAHYQLGKLYYYEIKDYQAAGYHFETCVGLEPSFPDVYYPYLHLVVFLNMEKKVTDVTAKALATPGVNATEIYYLQGLFYEKNKKWTDALRAYHNAFMDVTHRKQKDDIEESINRVKAKMQQNLAYQYHMQD
jgi:tetratricopeptide (TPR) repeat protein